MLRNEIGQHFVLHDESIKPPSQDPPKIGHIPAPAGTVDLLLAEAVDTDLSTPAMAQLKLPDRPGRPPKSSIKPAPAEIADANSSVAVMAPLKLPAGRPGRPPKLAIKPAPAETVDPLLAEAVDTDLSTVAMVPLKLPGRPGVGRC